MLLCFVVIYSYLLLPLCAYCYILLCREVSGLGRPFRLKCGISPSPATGFLAMRRCETPPRSRRERVEGCGKNAATRCFRCIFAKSEASPRPRACGDEVGETPQSGLAAGPPDCGCLVADGGEMPFFWVSDLPVLCQWLASG